MLSTQVKTRDNLAFFTVMGNSDLWKELRKHMYPGKKTGNWYTWNGTGDVAASHKYLSLMDTRPKLQYTEDAMENATRKGNLDVVKWLYENRIELRDFHAGEHAVECGHLEIVKWLDEVRNPYEPCTWLSLGMDIAARHGHLEIIKWLHGRSYYTCTTYAVPFAETGGHTEVVKWLKENVKYLETLKFLYGGNE